jgi:hypothetical protein
MKIYSQQERRLHVEAWQGSELTKTDYCQQNDISLKSLNRWLTLYTESSVKLEMSPAFIPAKVKLSAEKMDTLGLSQKSVIICQISQLPEILRTLASC